VEDVYKEEEKKDRKRGTLGPGFQLRVRRRKRGENKSGGKEVKSAY
jgi:hypothetical protein